jgi:hypothetical protein
LLDFSIGVDATTTSVHDAIKVFQLNPASGFATPDDFINYLSSPSNNFFSFDPASHTLAALTEIPLFNADITDTSSASTLTFNYEAAAGTVPEMPEPSSAVLTGLGLAVLLLRYRPSRRLGQIVVAMVGG